MSCVNMNLSLMRWWPCCIRWKPFPWAITSALTSFSHPTVLTSSSFNKNCQFQWVELFQVIDTEREKRAIDHCPILFRYFLLDQWQFILNEMAQQRPQTRSPSYCNVIKLIQSDIESIQSTVNQWYDAVYLTYTITRPSHLSTSSASFHYSALLPNQKYRIKIDCQSH